MTECIQIRTNFSNSISINFMNRFENYLIYHPLPLGIQTSMTVTVSGIWRASPLCRTRCSAQSGCAEFHLYTVTHVKCALLRYTYILIHMHRHTDICIIYIYIYIYMYNIYIYICIHVYIYIYYIYLFA